MANDPDRRFQIPLELVYTSAIVPVGPTGNGNNQTPAPVANVVTPPASTARTYSPTELQYVFISIHFLAARSKKELQNQSIKKKSINLTLFEFDSKSQSFTSEGCPSESPLGQEPENNLESPVSLTRFQWKSIE